MSDRHLGEHRDGDSAYTHQAKAGASRSLIIAVVLTAGYAVVELIGGFLSGSLALLADSGHMATDAAALVFALMANLVARRPVSGRHSFGLARIEVLAAFVNALAMIAVVAWIFVEAIKRIGVPVEVQGGDVFVIATIGLVVNVAVAWTLSHEHDNLNARAAFLHVMGDLLGSVAAIVAGVVIYFGGPTIVDPLLSMFVAALILRSTIGVLRETVLVLMDSVPKGVDFSAVGETLARIPGVLQVHDLHVWSMVPERSALSAHVLIEDIADWPAILRQARASLSQQFHIDHVTLQPEWLRPAAEGKTVPIKPL